MDKFDLIVIGSGAGTHVASIASKEGLKVALVDQGPAGGVCLNNGCIPSKMLIYPADVIRILQDAKEVGVDARIAGIDFQMIMSRMYSVVENNCMHLEKAINAKENIAWYKDKAEFIGGHTLQVGDKTLTAPKIVIATGARALVPPIQGLNEVGYLDNVTLLNLEEPPESMIIVGAGYVACEYGHFFSAMGTEVTIIGRGPRVLKKEDPEVSQIVSNVLGKFLTVLTNHEVVGVKLEDGMKVVSAHNHIDNKIYEFHSNEILLAAGRRSNSDFLKPDRTGVETDKNG
jgi:mycothione reductase